VLDICAKTILLELNQYMQARTGLKEDVVVFKSCIGNALRALSSSTSKPPNKTFMGVINLIEEDINQTGKTYVQQGNHYIVKNVPLNFYLHLLFATSFQDEHALAGLQHLSLIVAFFQFKNTFNTQNTPTLQDTGVDAFSASILKIDPQQYQSLWQVLQTPYLPSIVYKVGLLSIADNPAQWPEVPSIQKIHTTSTPQR